MVDIFFGDKDKTVVKNIFDNKPQWSKLISSFLFILFLSFRSSNQEESHMSEVTKETDAQIREKK